MPTVGLTMIAKNEAHIIRRCLDSVRPLVDYVLVVDTGSSDGTQDAVRAWLAEHKMPGQVIDAPWRDFAHNRSQALEFLRRRAEIDYALMIDADEVLEFEPGFKPASFKKKLSDEIYNIVSILDGYRYLRAQLVSNRKPFRYIGVLHECVDADDLDNRPIAAGIVNRPIQDGARSANPNTSRDDAAILQSALAGETNPFLVARYTFYLAQSFRDARDFANALVHYVRRTELGQSDQEIYVSYLQIASLKNYFGLPAEEILDAYRQAIELCPERAEAYHGASHYLRLHERFAEGFEIAEPAIDLAVPERALFAALWIYRYGALDEYAVNAYWSGHYRESLAACVRILQRDDIDAETRARVEKNGAFARDKMAALAAPGTPPSASAAGAGPALPRRPAGGAPRTIGLSMIVKNEAHVIARCLESVRPVIDYALIVDTGSNDGTQEVIRQWLRANAIAGEVIDEPWRDFAYNRTFALEKLRQKTDIDYALVIDADDVLEREPGFDVKAFKARLDADVYDLPIHHGGTIYRRPQLFSNRMPFRYKAVLHEYLECPDGHRRGDIAGLHITLLQESARNKNPRKYADDARVLEQALAAETDPFLIARYTFYLAQSYKDHGNLLKALKYYSQRIELGYWAQEIYICLLNLADIKRRLNCPPEEILATYDRAIKLCPDRAEAYHGAALYLRGLNRFAEAYRIAKPGLDLEPPRDGLFVNPWIYANGLLDEFAVSAYWAGHYQESLAACRKILARRDIDPATRRRVEDNAAFAQSKINEAAGQGSAKIAPPRYPRSDWIPARPQGGTEIAYQALRQRLGSELDKVELGLNGYAVTELTGKPLIVWFHHNIDQQWVQWCRDPAMTARVERFVFVSHWQMQHYIRAFGLAPQRCLVLRNAVPVDGPPRPWQPASPRRMAYISTPFRGLSVLLDAWERLRPANAELHVWSSMGLYATPENDGEYADLFARAHSIDNVHHRGIVPNDQLLKELATTDFLIYPSTFEETSCLGAIEAMSRGVRIICPALGALPETTAGFARLYPVQPDAAAHAEAVAAIVDDELRNPWQGRPQLALAQQEYCRAIYDWSVRAEEWRALLAQLQPRT